MYVIRYPCEVRVRSVPLQPCRRHGKKRKEDEPDVASNKKDIKSPVEKIVDVNRPPMYQDPSRTPLRDSQLSLEMASMLEGMDAQLQSSQVSSTVLDSPVSMYQNWNYQTEQQWNRSGWLDQRKNNWMNPWSEYGPFGGLDRETKVDPDSTSLDDTRPRSTISQEDYGASRNLQNSSSESARGNYIHSPRHPISPRGSLPSTPAESIYSTPPRACPSTPQDQRIISPRSSGYSSAPSEFSLSSPSPRNYQNSLENRQNSMSPRAGYQNPPIGLESPQRNTPSRNNLHVSTPIGSETSRRNQSPSMNQLRSPGLNSSDSFPSNISPARCTNEQNQRFSGHATQNVPEMQHTKTSYLSKLQAYAAQTGAEIQKATDYANQTNAMSGSMHTDYSLQNPLSVQSFANQKFSQQNENLASNADQKSNLNTARGAANINYPVATEQSNWSSLSSWGNETVKRPVQPPTNNTQQSSSSKFEYGNLPKTPTWDERLSHPDPMKPTWETPAEPPSPFRVPKGRPPSRTTPNHNQSSESGSPQNSSAKRFLKPQEPNVSGKTCTTGQNHPRKPEWPEDKLREGNTNFLCSASIQPRQYNEY